MKNSWIDSILSLTLKDVTLNNIQHLKKQYQLTGSSRWQLLLRVRLLWTTCLTDCNKILPVYDPYPSWTTKISIISTPTMILTPTGILSPTINIIHSPTSSLWTKEWDYSLGTTGLSGCSQSRTHRDNIGRKNKRADLCTVDNQSWHQIQATNALILNGF